MGGQTFFGLHRKDGREVLLLAEIVITNAPAIAEQVLRPTVDLLWNSFGYPRSFSFDLEGRYVGERY